MSSPIIPEVHEDESQELCDPTWLAQHYEDTRSVRVLDVGTHLPAAQRDAEAEYQEVRVPGALRWNIDEIADSSSGLPHMLPTPAQFEAAARARGIGAETQVIVYENRGLFAAARSWWAFRYFGHNNVRILDGGLPAWRAAGLPVASGAPETRDLHEFAGPSLVARPRTELLKNLEELRKIVAEGGACILDARSAERFSGVAAEPRKGLRSGHMPGADNLPWGRLVTEEGRLRPREELRELLEPWLEAPAITCSCGSGVTACILALALHRIGRRDAAVYDGSWSEWGLPGDNPVETDK